jgi:hypothetical protein
VNSTQPAGPNSHPLTAKQTCYLCIRFSFSLVQSSGTNDAVRAARKPIFISVFEQGGANPSLSAKPATLSERGQPLDEPFLADMLLTDRAKSMKEILDRALLLGERLKIEEKLRRLVIGGGVATLDFGLDLAPDAFTPPRYRQ